MMVAAGAAPLLRNSVKGFALLLAGALLAGGCARPAAPPSAAAAAGPLRDGDIVFQSTLSPQGEAIRRATRSAYNHCGIVFISDGETRVLEAVEPVRWTNFREWRERGIDDAVAVRRLRDAAAIMTPAQVKKLRALGERWLGKHYDLYFGWSDEKLYCSELVYKLYRQVTGVELGELKKLRDFDLDDFLVRKMLKERYGERIPLDEPVISPADLFAAAPLLTVGE